jgi:hypothetical protein
MTELRHCLLTKHQMMLRSEPGVGYRVIVPEKQTSTALKDGTREMQRTLARMSRELIHVDHSRLDDAARKENTDALARLAQLRSFVTKTKRLTSSDD